MSDYLDSQTHTCCEPVSYQNDKVGSVACCLTEYVNVHCVYVLDVIMW